MTNSEKLKAKKEEKTFDFDFGIEILPKLIELKEFSVNIFFICLHEIRIFVLPEESIYWSEVC